MSSALDSLKCPHEPGKLAVHCYACWDEAGLDLPESMPIRQHTPRPVVRPDSRFARACDTCGASFLALAPGKTGERGIWRDWQWFCSQECAL